MKGFLVFWGITFFVFLIGISWNCNAQRKSSQVQDTQIRIVNESSLTFMNVNLFSMKFPDLYPGDTTDYKVLNYDSLEDDPLIYCTNEGVRYASYVVIPGDDVEYYTYAIDSVSNRIIYISSREELKHH